MALRGTFKSSEAGKELFALERRVEILILEISAVQTVGMNLQTMIGDNVDGFYTLPEDLNEVNAVLIALRDNIQAAAAAL